MVELVSVLACSECGHQACEAMPTDACRWYYGCPGCGVLLRPKPGDCRVFCSHGSLPRPPVRLHGRTEEECCGEC